IQPLARYSPAAMGFDSYACAHCLDVLPAELVRNAETIVRGRVHGVESAMDAVMRIFVAGSIIILAENARLPVEPGKSVSQTIGSAPGPDVVRAVGTDLASPFAGIIEIGRDESLRAHAV